MSPEHDTLFEPVKETIDELEKLAYLPLLVSFGYCKILESKRHRVGERQKRMTIDFMWGLFQKTIVNMDHYTRCRETILALIIQMG